MSDVSVIVPVRTHAGALPALLASLAAQTLDTDRFEVLLVENGEGRVGDLERDAGRLRLRVLRSAPGAYAARNAGLAASRAPHLAFTDVDCLPAPDWLERGLAHLEAAPRAAGRIDLLPRPEAPYASRLERARFFRQARYVEEGFGATANLFVRRAVFDVVGPFDARLRSGGDAEHGLRASRLGFSIVYAADAVVKHPARPLGELCGKALRVGVGFGQAVRLGKIPPRALLARARERLSLVGPGARHLPRRPWEPSLAPGLAGLAALTFVGAITGALVGPRLDASEAQAP